MILATPKSAFSWDYDFETQDGWKVRVDLRNFRTGGTIELEQPSTLTRRTLELENRRRLRLDLELLEDGRTRGLAAPTTWSHRSFRLEWWSPDGVAEEMVLTKTHWYSAGYRLERDGQELLDISHPKWLSRKAAIRLAVDLPPDLVAFCLAVVVLLWRRAAASS